ncbi:MAG: hypothetical protein K8W52_40355 [Deltaproteobacteria bacterium]|nr:hypothetical protein [Deltaproteobacteria bacterium]
MEPRTALDRWTPRACALLAFVLGAAFAPILGAADAAAAQLGATVTGPPLPATLARIAQAIPIGDLAYRAHLAQAAIAAALAWLAATIVIDTGKGDRASTGGAIAAGLAAAAGPLCGAADLAGGVGAIFILIVIAAGERTWRGGGAGAGLAAALCAGLALGHGAGAIGVTIVLGAILVRRLRAGARWPLAAPAALALGFIAAVAPLAMRSVRVRDLPAALAGDHALARAADHARVLVSTAGDDLGAIGFAAALAGLLVLATDRRYRWLGAALVAAAATDLLAAATIPTLTSVPATTAALAAIAAGIAIERLARTSRLAAGQLAIGATCAVLVALPAGLASADRATPVVVARPGSSR